MEYNEVFKDLFTVDESYYLAHCISADAKMGAGIAALFVKKFNHLKQLQKNVTQTKMLDVGTCVKDENILNLVTKNRYWNKPTYDTLTMALRDMKRLSIEYNIKRIAMPQIGAGLDKLNWETNREIIKEVFCDTDIEILVCKFN